MINVAVCDDNMQFAEKMMKQLKVYEKKRLLQMHIDIFTSGTEFFQAYDSGKQFDILYMDIVMKPVNGIQVANELRRRDRNIVIIFVSAYTNYVTQLFDAEPVGFLEKPVSAENFKLMFEKAYKKVMRQENYFVFSFKRNSYKVLYRDIIYFESKGRIVTVVTKDQRMQFYDKLNQVEQSLQENKMAFLRIHQSFLVNTYYIEAIDYPRVYLKNGQELPISEDRQKKVKMGYLKSAILM